jgi:hypothetical protein
LILSGFSSMVLVVDRGNLLVYNSTLLFREWYWFAQEYRYSHAAGRLWIWIFIRGSLYAARRWHLHKGETSNSQDSLFAQVSYGSLFLFGVIGRRCGGRLGW